MLVVCLLEHHLGMLIEVLCKHVYVISIDRYSTQSFISCNVAVQDQNFLALS